MTTVKMTRDEPAHPGGPTTADVHPDEVESMETAGWRRAKSPDSSAERPSARDLSSKTSPKRTGE